MTPSKQPSKPRTYGWRPDQPDGRDLLYSTPIAARIPSMCDLRVLFQPVPVEDQGSLGSCVANAAAGMIEYHRVNRAVLPHRDYSRLYLYYFTRLIEGTLSQDNGCQIRNAMKALAKYGVCRESIWPYSPDAIAKTPSQEQIQDAGHIRLMEYKRLRSLRDIKYSLYHGHPVEFGFQIYESFESEEVARTGRVPMPRRGFFSRERCLGGHAVLAVGYHDNMDYPGRKRNAPRGCMICRNSWGDSWGESGHFFLPYPFLTDPDLSADFWTLTRIDFGKEA